MGSPTCPACGAPVQFRSAAPYTVCPYCRSLLVRRDVSLESIGRVAEVPADLSPLQLHTSGVFEKHAFTLVGRIRKTWEEGSWSEWCAQFDQSRFGWLAEAQGDLVMTFEQPLSSLSGPASTCELLAQARAGATLMIAARAFAVSDVKQVHVTAAEGDLTHEAITGMTMTSIDLKGPGMGFATIEVARDQMRLFVGRFVEFEECRFSNLRTLQGWS